MEMNSPNPQFAPGLAGDLLRQVIHRGKQPLFLFARGKSMEPNIRAGDMIEVAVFKLSDAKKGDILLFKRGGELLLHRVLYLSRSGVWLKGDGLLLGEGWVSPDMIVGKAVRMWRGEREYSLTDCRALSRARVVAGISGWAEGLYKTIARVNWGFTGKGSELARGVIARLMQPFRLPLTLPIGL
jgi:hypothetical protein